MALVLSYKSLFKVAVRHHYFLDDGQLNFEAMPAQKRLTMLLAYDVESFLRIRPTAATQKILDGHKYLFKATDQGFLIGTPVYQETGNTFPLNQPAGELILRFTLAPEDYAFANYTALPLTTPAGFVYYFTNQSTLKPRLAPSLAATAPVFAAGTTYRPGDQLVNDATDPTTLFIAQKQNNKNPAAAGTPAGLWQTDLLVGGKPLSYVNGNDLIRQYGQLFSYEIPVAGKMPALTLKNGAGVPVTLKTTILTGDKNTLKADISGLPEGIYTALLETPDATYTESFAFYHFAGSASWGIIEIEVKGGSAAYNLFTAEGALKQPEFTLRFKNRSTFWRYLDQQLTVKTTAGPFPLTRTGFIEVGNFPNPSALIIKPESDQYVSEIFVP